MASKIRKAQFKTSLIKLENILGKVLRGAGRRSSIEFENELRRALRHIEIIKNTAFGSDGDLAMIRAYEIYSRLQRLKDSPQLFSDSTKYNPGRVVSDRGKDYTNARPASVRWDVASMMAVPMTGEDRNWWRPPPRPEPVKHYTKEELEHEYPAFTVSKKRDRTT